MPVTRTEEYLEAIYEIVEEKGAANVTDVARLLDVSLSTVSEMFGKLSCQGYVNYEKYHGVTFTKKGEKIAIELTKTHKVLKSFFIILGIRERIADEDACKIEHVVNNETMERLTKFVDFIRKDENSLFLERFRVYCEKII